MTGFVTKSVHGPRNAPLPHGSLRGPLYDNAAFEFASSDDIAKAFQGRSAAHSYTRVSNPSVAELEERVAHIANARGVIAVASGMAAISNAILTLAGSGANIVASRFLFGNTLALFEKTLAPWGLSGRYVDFTKPEEVAAAIDADTAAVFFESISNPQMEVVDIPAIAAIAHARNIPVILDGTATTPWLLPTKELGVDVELISSTKYISGGATSIGGLIIDNGSFDWRKAPRLEEMARRHGPFAFIARLRHQVYHNIGAAMAPHNAWLQVLGLETLALRIERGVANALALARWLESRAEVVAVNYPGLESAPCHKTAKALLKKGYGSLLTFSLADRASCFAFMDALRLVRRATNIHDNKTLIIHPASTIFAEFSEAQRGAMGVGDGMMRLAVGIEDVEDVMDDLSQGFAALSGEKTAEKSL